MKGKQNRQILISLVTQKDGIQKAKIRRRGNKDGVVVRGTKRKWERKEGKDIDAEERNTKLVFQRPPDFKSDHKAIATKRQLLVQTIHSRVFLTRSQQSRGDIDPRYNPIFHKDVKPCIRRRQPLPQGKLGKTRYPHDNKSLSLTLCKTKISNRS